MTSDDTPDGLTHRVLLAPSLWQVSTTDDL